MFIEKMRNGIIGLMFGRRVFNPPTEYWIGVSTVAINPDGTGIVEPNNSTNYRRVRILNSTTNFAVPANGKVTNLTKIEFPELNTECGSAKAYFISDTETGNAIMYQNLSEVDWRPLPANSTLYINVGDAEFTCI